MDMRFLLRVAVVAGLAVSAGACASSGGGGRRAAGDEMEAGYKAARRWYWQEALLRFEAANRARPQEARILNNLAVALEAVGRYDEARTAYEQAIQAAPGNRQIDRNYQRFKDFYESFVAHTEDGDEAGESPDRAEEKQDDARSDN
jgi:tetratricopeptide (TPR) repeat protein